MDQETATSTAGARSVARPGALRGESWITIQTRQAQRLIAGRKAEVGVKGIIGLTQFASIVSRLFVAARMDDPYAQWWLVKIEQALHKSRQDIERMARQVQDLLNSAPGFTTTIAESLSPIQVPLKFANPYAYQAARLIIAFDDLMRVILTARHVGLMGREEAEKAANLGGRAVRRALNSALGYKHKLVSRKDIQEGNARAREACELMGEVPPEILDRTLQAEFAPEPVSGTRKGDVGHFGFARPTLQSPTPSSGATEQSEKPMAQQGDTE